MSNHELLALSDREFTELVQNAFAHFSDLSWLIHCPLADCSVTAAAVVPGETPTSASDSGRALRVALRWAAVQLAPGAPLTSGNQLPEPRDGQWTRTSWWNYFALRHWYLEPAAQDGESAQRSTVETLLTRAGIPGRRRFNSIRQRAISLAARIFRKALLGGRDLAQVTELALSEFCQPLKRRRDAWDLLRFASIFPGAVAHDRLVALAETEGITASQRVLEFLVEHRALEVGTDGMKISVPERLRRYIARGIPRDAARRWHARALSSGQDPLAAAERLWHQCHVLDQPDLLAAIYTQLRDGNHKQLRDVLTVLETFAPQELAPPGRELYEAVRLLAVLAVRYPGLPLADLCGAPSLLEPALGETAQLLPRALAASGFQFPQAEALFQRATRALPRGQRAWRLARLLHASLAADMLDGDRALLMADDAVAVHGGEAPSAASAGLAGHVRARALLILARSEDALAEARQALALLEQTGPEPFRTLCHVTVSDAHLALFQFDRARRHAQLVVNRSRQRGFVLGLTAGLRALAAALLDLREPVQALGLLQEAEAAGAGPGLPLDLYKTHVAAARCLAELGRTNSAAGHIIEAEALAVQLAAPTLTAQAAAIWDDLDLDRIPAASTGLARARAAVMRLGRHGTQFPARHLAAALDCSPSTAWRFLRQLEQMGVVERIARACGAMFTLADSAHPASAPATELESTLQQQVLHLLRRAGRVTLNDVIDELGASRSSCQRALARLTDLNLIRRVGKTRGTVYLLPDAQ